ncbi:hypothetical protein WJX84_011413, partial [Apatococcus fuscideae]
KDGKQMPGRKGISLSTDQFTVLQNAAGAITTALEAEDENYSLELSTKRRASISVFKKKPMVNIREYYEKDGEQLPGKKGISLAAEQWRALADGLPALQQGLEKLLPSEPAQAQPAAQSQEASRQQPSTDSRKSLPRKVYLEFNVNSAPKGRVEVELFDDAPVGSERFHQLAVGTDGVGYRLSKVDGVSKDFVKSSGVSRLSYKEGDETSIVGGDALGQLEAEMEVSGHQHSKAGLVSIIVKDLTPRQTKQRLIAYKGKLISVEESLGGSRPNGTSFAITLQSAPELDRTNLVVGRVVAGMDVIQELAALPSVKANKDSPYFKVAKAMGDKRANVAELGFGRPLAKVIIAQSGAIEGGL